MKQSANLVIAFTLLYWCTSLPSSSYGKGGLGSSSFLRNPKSKFPNSKFPKPEQDIVTDWQGRSIRQVNPQMALFKQSLKSKIFYQSNLAYGNVVVSILVESN